MDPVLRAELANLADMIRDRWGLRAVMRNNGTVAAYNGYLELGSIRILRDEFIIERTGRLTLRSSDSEEAVYLLGR